MYLILAKGYTNAGVRLLIEKETCIFWASMKNIQDRVDVQTISDLVLKKIYGMYKNQKKPYKKYIYIKPYERAN